MGYLWGVSAGLLWQTYGTLPLWNLSIVGPFHCGTLPLWDFSIAGRFQCLRLRLRRKERRAALGPLHHITLRRLRAVGAEPLQTLLLSGRPLRLEGHWSTFNVLRQREDRPLQQVPRWRRCWLLCHLAEVAGGYGAWARMASIELDGCNSGGYRGSEASI